MRGKQGKRLLFLFSSALLIFSSLPPMSGNVEAATISPPSGNTSLFSNDFESVTDTGPVYPGSTATVGGFTPLFQYAPSSGDTTDSISLQNASDFKGTSTNNGSKVLVLTDTNDAASISGDGTTVSFTPGTASDQIGVTKLFSNSGITSGSLGIEFDYATTNISSGTYLFKLLGGASYSQSPVLIYLGMKNGYLSWYDSSNYYHYITSSSLSKNTWYHIKLSVNLDNFTYNVTITPTGSTNSLGSVNQVPFMQNAVSNGNNVSWSSKNSITSASAQMIGFNTAGSYSGQIALDNVQVYQPTTVPDTPTGVSDFVGDGQVWLWWPSVNNAASYDILRGTDASGPFTSLTNGAGMISPPTQANPYEDLGLTDGTTYYYVVRASDSFGSSDSPPLAATPSNSVPAPQPPTGLSSTVRDSSVTVSWNMVSNATGYTLERSTSPDMSSPVVLSSSLPYNQTSYYDANLTDGTTYYYALSSQGAGGASVLSTSFAVAPSSPLAYPDGLTANPGNARVDIAWNSVAAAASYNVKRSSTSGGPYTTIANNLTITNYTDSSVSNGSVYYYVVSAVSPTMESMNSPQVQAVPYSSANNAPTTPTGASIVAGDSQLNLSWNAVSGATQYNVKRATAYSGPYTVLTNVTGTTYQDTAVTKGAIYYSQISAINSNGEGANS
ncbi:MAG: hypothetical protein JWN30_2626, partial [Bacilli bacterium]|nr:hypothetical protein [Bacilli bacterium]